jgi:hypothetical protein
MNFVERLFGFAPDGGSGGLEILLLAVPIVGLCCVALSRIRRFFPGLQGTDRSA